MLIMLIMILMLLILLTFGAFIIIIQNIFQKQRKEKQSDAFASEALRMVNYGRLQ